LEATLQAWTDTQFSQEVEDPRISRQSAHEGGNVVSSMYWPPLPPRKYSWYSFLLETESTPGP
jgi:hypothetical protein